MRGNPGDFPRNPTIFAAARSYFWSTDFFFPSKDSVGYMMLHVPMYPNEIYGNREKSPFWWWNFMLSAISKCLRFLMPPVPQDLFLEMCYEAVRANPWFLVPAVMRNGNGNFVGKVLWGANADWVPPEGKGALYLRPLLMGSQVLSDAVVWWGFWSWHGWCMKQLQQHLQLQPQYHQQQYHSTIIPLPIPISLSSSTTIQ